MFSGDLAGSHPDTLHDSRWAKGPLFAENERASSDVLRDLLTSYLPPSGVGDHLAGGCNTEYGGGLRANAQHHVKPARVLLTPHSSHTPHQATDCIPLEHKRPRPADLNSEAPLLYYSYTSTLPHPQQPSPSQPQYRIPDDRPTPRLSPY